MEFQVNSDIVFVENPLFKERLDDIVIQKYVHHVSAQSVAYFSDNILTEFEPISPSFQLEKRKIYVFDFGKHCVGHVYIDTTTVGSPPDAPLKFKYQFGECLEEVSREPEDYKGELSSSWIQEGLETVDVLPITIDLRRRFAFRYLKLTVLSTSPKYDVCVTLHCNTTSAVDEEQIHIIDIQDNLLKKIDYVSQKTLVDCMQDVFEDGPKRDRRLWLGDLRLQARANYTTFKNNDLVKRCLYLFASKTTEEGQVSANIFFEPEIIPDDTFLADYSLFFIDTLLDYYLETGDHQTLSDLYPVAVKQAEILSLFISEIGQVQPQSGWWAFIDWHETLDKLLAIQGVFISSYKKLLELATILGDKVIYEKYYQLITILEKWVLENCYDEERKVFVSPETKQISIASQSWLVLAGVGTPKLRLEVMRTILEFSRKEVVDCNTPYMYHHFVEALFEVGLTSEALNIIQSYWGGMIEAGADTFWEVFNPTKPGFSPYGDTMIDSYCHAWSCTPCYLLRKYL